MWFMLMIVSGCQSVTFHSMPEFKAALRIIPDGKLVYILDSELLHIKMGHGWQQVTVRSCSHSSGHHVWPTITMHESTQPRQCIDALALCKIL